MKKRLAVSLTIFISLLLLSQGLEIPEVVVYGEREIKVSPPEKPLLPFVRRDIKPTFKNPEPEVKEEKGEILSVPPDYGYFVQVGAGTIAGIEAGFFTQGSYFPQVIKGVYQSKWDRTEDYFEGAYSISPVDYIDVSVEYTTSLESGLRRYYLRPAFSFSIPELDFLGWFSYSGNGIVPGIGLGLHFPIAEITMNLKGSSFTGEAVWSRENFSIGVGLIDVLPVPVLRVILPRGFYINTMIKTGSIDSSFIPVNYLPFASENTYRFELGNDLAGAGYVFIPADTLHGGYVRLNAFPFRPEIYYFPSTKNVVAGLIGSQTFMNLYGLIGVRYSKSENLTGFADVLYNLNRHLSIGIYTGVSTNPFNFKAMLNVRYSSH